MSHLRVTNETGMGVGTRIELDGVEVQHARSIEIRVNVDDPIAAKIEVLALDSALDLQADVHVTFVAYPGYDLEETPLPDGGKRYRAVLPSQVNA